MITKMIMIIPQVGCAAANLVEGVNTLKKEKGQVDTNSPLQPLRSVRDIMCSRCGSLVGWTYDRAYEESQKYKEGKFILEKMRIYLEESDYGMGHPAGERNDRWRKRSMSWGTEEDMVYEYESRGGEKRRGSGP